MRKVLSIAAFALLSACGGGYDPANGCGLLACTSSPYVQARGNYGLVGSTPMAAMNVMGGAPDSTAPVDAKTTIMTWKRVQQGTEAGTLACAESIAVRDGKIVDYGRRGACG